MFFFGVGGNMMYNIIYMITVLSLARAPGPQALNVGFGPLTPTTQGPSGPSEKVVFQYSMPLGLLKISIGALEKNALGAPGPQPKNPSESTG